MPIANIAQAIGKGGPLPPMTREDIDRGNAEHAIKFAGCTQAETVELFRSSGEQAAGIVRSLSDTELDHSIEMALMGGQKVSAQHFIQMVLLGHLQEHL